ncbi:hypothetical protein MRX96_026967 [Rhipicephalus microplus]
MTTAMRVEEDGYEISPEECTRSQGWKTAGEKVRLKGADKRSLNPALRANQEGAEATADINSRGNHLGDGATSSDSRGLRLSASKQRDRSQTPDCSSNNSGSGNGRQSRSRWKPRSGGAKGGGNRRWETTHRTASVSRACSKPRTGSSCRACSKPWTGSSCQASSSSRAGSKPRHESTEHRGIAEKKLTVNRDTLNTMLRKTMKQALGVPIYSSTLRLLDMGARNKVEELIEAHLSD